MNAHLLVLLLALPATALGHEVRHQIGSASVRVVTLSYADGKPFAYEQFELTPQGSDVPAQVGRTDAQGRIAVLPVADKSLTLVASSKDGHGVRLELPPVGANTSGPAQTSAEAVLPRWLLAAAGGGILFGVFGLFQLFSRRKTRP
jgi:nickel transport protein